MQVLKYPFLKLQLTPNFNSSKNATTISISLTIEAPKVSAGETLYLFTTNYDNLPSFQYESEDIRAFDSAGPLAINFRASCEAENEQEWYVDRSTTGNVTLELRVLPRTVDIHTALGPRLDMRYDQGGLQGSGMWFLPRPDTKLTYRNIVEWDLSKSPAGTRAVWTFGEGPGAVEKEEDNQVLQNTTYMVGPIQSYPEQSTVHDSEYSGMYWFGNLPPNIDQLKDFNSQLFLKMSAFFDNPAGPSNTYRIFVRKVLRGYGGTGNLASYVLEYDEDSKDVANNVLTSLITHEMVHSWAIIDPEDDGNQKVGIANYYAAVHPLRFGLKGADYFRDVFNGHLSTYFTSPRIHMSNLDSDKDFWRDWYAMDIPYTRGAVYFLKIDDMLAEAARDIQADARRPLDRIIAELAVRRLQGQKLQAKDWLDLLYPYVGKERADKDFEDVSSGKKVLDLSETEVFGNVGKLVKVRQEIMEYGFDRSSLIIA